MMLKMLLAARPLRRAHGIVIAAAIGASITACGGGATTQRSPEASPAGASPTASAATTKTIRATVCTGSAAIRPQSPTDVTVNADGDGIPDRLTMFTQPGPPDANRQPPPQPSQEPEFASPQPTFDIRSYELQLVLDEQAAFTIDLGFGSRDRVAPIGGYDVDGDGRDELFAVTGSGASTTWIDIFEFDPPKCELVRITNPDPHWMLQFPLFAVGASTGHGNGLECVGHTLISVSYLRTSNEPPLRYEGTRTTYRLNGTQIEQVSQTPVAFVIGTPEPGTSPTFDCGSLRLPP